MVGKGDDYLRKRCPSSFGPLSASDICFCFSSLPLGRGWHRHDDLLLLGRSSGYECCLCFSFPFDVLFQVLGLQKTPAVPGGPGVFVAPCVSWPRSRCWTRTSAGTATSRSVREFCSGFFLFRPSGCAFLVFLFLGLVAAFFGPGFWCFCSVRFPGVSLSVFPSRLPGFWRFVFCLRSCILHLSLS